METNRQKHSTWIAVIGGIAVALILIVGMLLTAKDAADDTQDAVRSVSLLYLDELAGRREQVVADNLSDDISTIRVAVGLLTEEDLKNKESLQNYQAQMKQLFNLEKFAFVDTGGLIYTSLGYQDNIAEYPFDYETIREPVIGIKDVDTENKKVVIAVPIDPISFENAELILCFMEIDMNRMLTNTSMNIQNNGITFSNLYTSAGIPLTNTILGGQFKGASLFEALKQASFDEGYSLEKMMADFEGGQRGVAAFTLNGIQEIMTYIPVDGTDWLLTYLIQESSISSRISSVSAMTIRRSLILSLIAALILILVFVYIIRQNRDHARILLQKETAEAEVRGKQEEMQQRLELQDQLLAQKEQQKQQEKMITALSADYYSVYYLELDKNKGICYQARSDIEDGFHVGDRFPYLEAVTSYAKRYVTEPYLEEFLAFIQPENVLSLLEDSPVISYRYIIHHHDRDFYEAIRFARVSSGDEEGEFSPYTVGACFADVDAETRRDLEQSQNLSDALIAAEEANKAKTAFLSSMSHEIRTPMNAIIGLDNIAMNDPEATDKIKNYLGKIGDSAHHLLDLINDILDMSRIESGRMTLKNEEFSFLKLIENINTMISGQCQDKGLDYQCRITGEVDDYYIGDNTKLRQVLINILGNSVKFTPAGGTVSLAVERIAAYEKKTTLRFTISDTGIGMSKEFLPHIFDAFAQEDSSTTSKYGSSGLGLAITKNIVEMMNGNIRVESEKGKGSVFTVTVTLMDAENKAAEADDISIRPHEMSVLIIDDDPVACEHARIVLEKVGISSELASSGPEAVEMVQLRQARRNPYNLILVDWQMPEMDGVETTRRIRAIAGHDSAIIILTAYRWDDVLEEATLAGVDSFISKPLFASTVMEEFRSALVRKNMSARVQAAKADLAGRKILLAEDVQINAEIMTMVLSLREMQVDLAENGRIALEKFENSPEGYYDAVLMDMRMPEMDGLEATRRIRALDRADSKSVPIIALTANAFDEDVQRSLQAGLNAHLSKPVEPETLYQTLESLIQA